jgi:hypothetical protein
MVQPTSAILILIGLGFRLFSPTDYLDPTRPPFILLRSYAVHVLFLPSFHSSFHLVLLHRHLFVHDKVSPSLWDSLSTVQVSYGLLSVRLGFLAASPIAGSIRGLFVHLLRHPVGC